MSYFTQDFLDFFSELEKNNNKEWFDANKKRYEKSVKNPFKSFVDEMIIRIQQSDPRVMIESKDAIFRINRDIRFSADKTPYKTNVSALISASGRKSHQDPGFYFEFSHKGGWLGGGAYTVEKDTLQKIRAFIADDPDEFEGLLNDADFKAKFGTIQGEKNKVIPKEFQEAAVRQPLIANKQFYYGAQFGPELVTAPDFAERLMDYWHAGRSMNEFLREAMNG